MKTKNKKQSKLPKITCGGMIRMFLIFIISLFLIYNVAAYDKYNIVHGYLYENCTGTDYGEGIDTPLTLTGSPTAYPFIQGSGCSFSGSEYYTNVTASDTNTIKTIEYWINHTTTGDTVPISMGGNSWGANAYVPLDNNVRIATYIFNNSVTIADTEFIYNIPYQTVHHILVTTNGTHMLQYVDGVYTSASKSYNSNVFPNMDRIVIGARHDDYSSKWTGGVSRITMFNVQFNAGNVTDSYNSGSGRDWLTYNSTPATTTILTSYNVTLTANPNDINTSLIGYVNYTATAVNLTSNNSIVNGSFMTLYYNMSTILNGGCAKFENQVCTDYTTRYINMTKTNNTYYTYQIRELDIFPGYYPFYQQYIDNTNVTYNYTTYNNVNIKFMIQNFTTYTNPFLSFEYDGNNISGLSQFQVYYCNSSYNIGSPVSNANCELVQNVLASSNLSSHTHGIHRHYVLPINIISTAKTQNSSIIIYNSQLIANGWNFEYVLNSTYNNRSFCIGNPSSWSCNDNKIFDMHIHQFVPQNDSFNTWVVFNDGSGNSNSSSIHKDYLDAINQPPSTPLITYPTGMEKITVSSSVNSSIFINWTNVTDYERDILSYSLYLTNGLLNYWITTNSTTDTVNYTWSTNANFTPSGSYYSRIIVCDNVSNCVIGAGDITLCQNSYINTTGVCVSGAALQTVVDGNGCDTLLAFPTIYNNTYVNCTVPPTQIQYSFSESQLVILIMLILIVISIVCGAVINPIFFYLTTLLFGFGIGIFIYYDMPPISYIASALFSIMFVFVAVFSNKARS